MNYYNDIDPKACEWIRYLISQQLIPPGDVDCCSILEIKPHELTKYVQCHFFCGIAGWSLALALAGVATDVRLWTGSCPCQPLSVAGKGLGHADERHLWPAFARLIGECSPPVVFGEQVASNDGREWFAGIRLDLEAMGYAVGGADLCAAGVASPNLRQRLFWVADSRNGGFGIKRDSETGRGESGSGGPACGMADMFGAGLEGQPGNERDGNQPGRNGKNAAGSTPAGGQPLRVANADGGNASTEREQCGRQQRLVEEDGGVAIGLGDTQDHGRPVPDGQERREDPEPRRASATGRMGNTPSGGRGIMRDEAQPGSSGHPLVTGWSGFEIIHCRDGKSRRIPSPVEPGVLRMADGIPEGMDIGWILGAFPLCERIQGRTALLKGIGNAINPVIAAEFIKAFREVSHEL